ncbi:MAG: enoyl-[acyl-carrier-protein] reductase FabK [Defluviitaleaceae bacterium]|nr:enoyl-[acyl-carrier-protein] reductase FabK [Defluviitaleaceae bacterium]
MKNRVCELLGIEYPIFQGGMAWIAESSLASAVSEAGGLGIIAAGAAPGEVVREQIKKTKAATSKPFGVNIMLMSPFADDIARICCEEGVAIVTTGAGTPGKYMEMFAQANIKVIPIAPSVAIAKKMEKMGAHAIIAEGMEAGGHIGKLTTMALVPQIVDAVSIPVIAAGGIANGRGVGAAFMLGASAVQIGTRFLVATECVVHENYKKAVLKAKDIDTVITGTITGHPVRSLRNKLTARFIELEKEEQMKETPDLAKIEEFASGTLRLAAVEGDVQNGSVMAGQIAAMVNKEQTCKEIIEEVWGEYNALIARCC